MTQENGIKRLKAALMFSIIVDLCYGIGFFIVPGMLSAMAGGTPVEHGWVRWGGALLLALAAGGISVYREPSHQHAMVMTLTAAALLAGLAHAYTLLFENYSINTSFILLPCVVALVLFGVLLWASQGVRTILE